MANHDTLVGMDCSVSYRIGVRPQEGRKVFMLQTIQTWEIDDRFVRKVEVEPALPPAAYTSPQADWLA